MKENKKEKKNTNSFSKKEIEDGKLMGVLSYISILSVIPYFIEKNNKFVVYHAKEGFNLFLLEVICLLVINILGPLLSFISWAVSIVSAIVGLVVLLLSIMGIVNVCNGELKELPIINKFKLVK